MLHQRSVSDPPLASPTTLGRWESPTLDSRPVTPLAPHDAHVYAKKPLPPLPSMTNPSAVPPPLNIKKKERNKPTSLPVGSSAPSFPGSDDAPQMEARSASPHPAPSTPAKRGHPPRLSSLPSPVSSIKRRTSKKVMQLMGHDVDVMNLVGTAAPPEADKEAVPRSRPSFDDPPALNPTAHLQLPEEGLVPVLEDDDGMDGMSSKKSSWGPGSPHSASAFQLAPHPSIRRRRSARIFDHDGPGQLAPPEDALMPASLNPDYDGFGDDMAAGEYHKFAVELAASAGAKPSAGEASPPSVAKGRRSSILSFTSGSQFSRLRRRPTTAEPHAASVGGSRSSSSAETSSHVQAAPAPEAEEPFVPKSTFESDSDSDHTSSRSRWRRDRSTHKGEDRGRDRGRDSPAAMTRRDDEPSRWAKTGDQMKGLLTVGKRRREQQQAKRETGVPNESVFA
ncbi:hypothetical protein Trco_005655 [Trichoderma cornu-damae]|uniref:Uncharacterized protein n=1 Tax=Trichoderma cornu-damae TaxID=654480 RepID=A0A9P8TVY9_9HYPO|nr:hypothetical protein Trco_005655 [Trichoderma cornu-damae]